MNKTLLIVVATPFLLYGVAMLALYYYQESLIFPGKKLPKDYSFSFDLPFKEVSIPVEGATLNALHFEQANPKGVIFFLHGNAGNLEEWTTGVDFYQRVNYDLFIFDYRGYGKSTGKIQSQEQLIADVRTAWDFIAPQYTDKSTVIYGRSLGSALATELAHQVKPELLVLVSAFSSMAAIAKAQYPFAPTQLLRYPFRTDKIIDKVASDIVLMHGSDDNFIPMSHSQTLQSLIKKPTQLLSIEGAGHNDIHNFKSYLDGLAGALP